MADPSESGYISKIQTQRKGQHESNLISQRQIEFLKYCELHFCERVLIDKEQI